MVHSSTSVQQKYFLVSNFSSSAQNHTHLLFINEEQKKLVCYIKICTGATPAGLLHATDTDFQTQREGLKVKVKRSMNVYSLFSLKSSISLFLHQHNDVNKFPTNRRNLCSVLTPPYPPPFFFNVGFVCVRVRVCMCVCVCVCDILNK